MVSCKRLSFNSYVPRHLESLTLSLLYPNNLLNLFLYQHFPMLFCSPLCDCGLTVQSVFHVVFECRGQYSVDCRSVESVKSILGGHDICSQYAYMLPEDFCTVLLNHSRDPVFMLLLLQRVQECQPFLQTHITLPSNNSC